MPVAERLGVDEHDEVELEPLGQLRARATGRAASPGTRGSPMTQAMPVGVRGEPGVEDASRRSDGGPVQDRDAAAADRRSARWRPGARPG